MWSRASSVEQRVVAARSRRMLRARRAVPPAVVPADDRDSGARAGFPEVIVDCPRPDAGRHGGRARGWGDTAVPDRRRAGHRGVRLRHHHCPAGRQDRRARATGTLRSAKALVAADCAIDFYAGPTEIVIVSDNGRAEWIAADLIAQAEHDLEARAILITTAVGSRRGSPGRRGADAGVRSRRVRRSPGTARSSSLATGTRLSRSRTAAPEHLVCDDERMAARVKCAAPSSSEPMRPRSPATTPSGRITCCRRAALPVFAEGCNTADFVRVSTVQRLTRRGLRRLAPTVIALAIRRGCARHAASIEVRAAMSYHRPADREGALRLHLNENTGGCSPEVLAAVRAVTAEDVATTRTTRRCARVRRVLLGVPETHLLLTNGLDEGLLASTIACFRTMQGSTAGPPEAIIVTPAFRNVPVFFVQRRGRIGFVAIPPKPGFSFPLREILQAVTPRTRLLFLDESEQSHRPDRSAHRSAGARRIAARRCDDRPGRGLSRLLRRDVPAGSRCASQCAGRPDVREGARPAAGLRAGCLIGGPGQTRS